MFSKGLWSQEVTALRCNSPCIVTNVFAYIKMTVLGCQVKWCNGFLHNGIYVIRVFVQDFDKENMPIFISFIIHSYYS